MYRIILLYQISEGFFEKQASSFFDKVFIARNYHDVI